MISEIIELLAFIFFIVFFVAISASTVILKLTNNSLKKDVEQGVIDLILVRGELEKALQGTEEKQVEETEGFLKFVSQSRDWAFQYIERVQITIKNFQDTFHPIAVEYDKNKERPITKEEFDKLFDAYKKLVEELPDEGKQ